MTEIWLDLAIGASGFVVGFYVGFVWRAVLRDCDEHERVIGAKWRER